jgi:predicted RNA-binding protein YlxR (DUF448 family)
VGCGRIAPKAELLRIAAVPGGAGDRAEAVCDPAGRLPGRGAYLCRAADAAMPAGDCLARATRRGGIARALRCAVKLDPKLVESP